MKGFVKKGSIQIREDKFIARYYFQGRELSKSFLTEEQAGNQLIEWYQRERGNSLDPRDWSRDQPLGFKNQVALYLERKAHKRSIGHIKRHLSTACQHFRNQNVKTIHYAQIDDYLLSLNNMGHASKTVANYMGDLCAFLSWVCKRERIEMPEIPEYTYDLQWRNITDKETQQRVLDELERIAPAKIHFFVLMLSTYTDIRPIELLHVKEEDINLDLGLITVKYNKVPRQYKRIYLLDEDVDAIRNIPRGFPAQYFWRHPQEAPVTYRGKMIGVKIMERWWARACVNIGLHGVTLYPGTRHTSVSSLDPERAKIASGHSTDKAFQRYFIVSAEKKRTISRSLRGAVVRLERKRDENS